MRSEKPNLICCRAAGWFFTFALIAAVAIFLFSGPPAHAGSSQSHFASPEDALKALVEAAKTKDKAAFNPLFGASAADLWSIDPVQASNEFDDFVKHVAEKSSVVKESDEKAIIQIGKENWPFPVPLIKKNGEWSFDTPAGKEEVLNRRIGENELTAILVCRTYVKAQREYVLKDWDGDGILAYAQKLRSDPGKKNGLFWRRSAGEPISPLGELISQARMEGYKSEKSLFKEKAVPFHGYYFKILTRQGKHAPGGKYNYVVNGNMVGGFALIAFPSDWGKSGVMSFIVNQQGKVFQKNLGEDTATEAQKLEVYDPDKSWIPIKN